MENENRYGQRRWFGDINTLNDSGQALKTALDHLGHPILVVNRDGRPAVTQTGTLVWGEPLSHDTDGIPLLGFAPPLLPEDLGDPGFKKDMGIRYAYVAGAMANGITSVKMLQAAGRAGMIGFFGAGGLPLDQIARAADRLKADGGDFPYGFNLIHNPSDPQMETATVELYLRHNIRLISA
ncbi:MAG: 2-nitropropane dioxygenase, partial [Desulfatitalea sp.]|nr:2-nitropropane dioxygenase [Desulfatitalea sp.]NNJ99458.1 2-nitropropane dioxygenase [Desulfatitalea sp.]